VRLSPREIEIVKLLAETAMSDKELADKLGISPNTMHAHMRNIGIKLQTNLNRTSISRMDIALFAISNGYADLNIVRTKYLSAGERLECFPS
jgi:DNA-binding CsgD family transcriptional regulator